MAAYSCPHCENAFEAELVPDSIIFCPHCNGSVSLPVEEELQPGVVLGGFEIQQLLGKGGMGYVYLAVQKSMQRNVALKVVAKTLTQDKAAINQFMNEVMTSGRMDHPNIVTAIDAGEDNGIYYLAMSYVKGEDLESRLDRLGALPEKIVLKYALQISDALKYAWEKHKLLHKDIKPGNIMVNEEGMAFLMDMGIAQHIGDTGKNKEHIEGSPFYMSPEQTRADQLDWSSDLYSMGATLYHLMTGVPPYDAPDITQIMEMHTLKPFPPIKDRAPSVKITKDTELLIKKMMGKFPADRFKSWEGFQKAVNKILKSAGEKPVQPKKKIPTSKNSRLGQMPFKQRSTAATLLTLLVCAIVLVGGGYFAMQFVTEAKADKSLETAMNYVKKPGYSDGEALLLFEKAVKDASFFTVRKPKFEAAFSEQEKVRKKAEENRQRIEKNNKVAEDLNNLVTKMLNTFKDGDILYVKKEFEAAIEKYKEVPAIMEAMEKIIPSFNCATQSDEQQIKLFKSTIEEQKKRMEYKIGVANTRLQAEKQQAQQGQQPQAAAQNNGAAAPAEKKDNDKKAENEERLASYKKGVAMEKERIVQSAISNTASGNFNANRNRLAPQKWAEKISSSDDFLKPSAEEFDKWLAEFAEKAASVEKFWEEIAKSDKKYKGIKLEVEKGKPAEDILKIADGTIVFAKNVKTTKNGKSQIENLSKPILSFDRQELEPLLKKAAEGSSDKNILFNTFLLSGEFGLALKHAAGQKEKEDFDAISFLYFKGHIKSLKQKNMLSDNDFNKEMEEFKKKYQGFPKFMEAEEAFKKETP